MVWIPVNYLTKRDIGFHHSTRNIFKIRRGIVTAWSVKKGNINKKKTTSIGASGGGGEGGLTYKNKTTHSGAGHGACLCVAARARARSVITARLVGDMAARAPSSGRLRPLATPTDPPAPVDKRFFLCDDMVLDFFYFHAVSRSCQGRQREP